MNTQRTLWRRFAAVGLTLGLLPAVVGCAADQRSDGTDASATSGSATEGSVLRPMATGSVPSTTTPPEQATTSSPPQPATTAPPPTLAPSPAPAPQPGPTQAVTPRDFLAPLVINDRPSPQGAYDRDAWSHWDDTDGDGCDARQQALIASSISPPQVDYYRCKVIAGDWFSAYDGVSTDDPSTFDVDHLVPLANAHDSGGWSWDAGTRRVFANDQVNLWVVSASSNRSKGARTPDQWRPERREVWCEFAVRWTSVKVAWGLTATSSERDALGQMLDTCGSLPPPPARG
jgi:hypothetical protein